VKLARALVATLALAACADESGADLAGLYRVTAVLADAGACDMDTEQPISPPYLLFHLEQGDADLAYYAYDACPDATGVACTAIAKLTEPGNAGWHEEIVGAIPSDATCTLSYDATSAQIDRESPTGLALEHHAYRNDAADPATCTVMMAASLADQMPCIAHDRIEASRL